MPTPDRKGSAESGICRAWVARRTDLSGTEPRSRLRRVQHDAGKPLGVRMEAGIASRRSSSLAHVGWGLADVGSCFWRGIAVLSRKAGPGLGHLM